ncbi:hypothetical protein RF11_00416 [Thelohanellus kitauei]|uniref:G-protein coupled receptors family 1 profile domain-containing protein n=1 Tax=Thelohanellus kitauei TaxID=669202 RepID=A0A0C2J5E7_THEKT|nr:hypothetical protein RF11_00416 [Thelohanellus kitauei]
MTSECNFFWNNILLYAAKMFINCVLWGVTILCVFFMIKYNRFSQRASNILVTNLLISDSLSALLSSVYREYINNCDVKPFLHCTFVLYFARTFGYISMSFLLFFTIERYVKLTTTPTSYEKIMSKTKIKIAIICIWCGFILFSLATTPYWIYLAIPNLRNSTVEHCVYSENLEPLIGLITLFISQFLSVIILVVVNVTLGFKVRSLVQRSEIRLGLSAEQMEDNRKLIKKVEINVFIMSLALTIMNVAIFGLTVIDLIKFLKALKLISYDANTYVLNLFLFFVTIYPFCEAMVCFLMNRDMIDCSRALWQATHRRLSVRR